MRLKLQADTDSNIKVSWGDGRVNHPTNYQLSKAAIDNVVSPLRLSLEELAHWHSNGPPEKLPAILKDLAKYGSYLKTELFSPVGSHAPNAQEMTELKQWIDDVYTQANDRELYITTDAAAHAPWGLLYDGNPDDLPDDCTSADLFKGFWCFKYQLSMIFYNCVVAAAQDDDAPTNLIAAINKSAQEHALESIQDQTTEKTLDELLSSAIGIADSFNECLEIIEGTSDGDIFLYFYGRSQDSEFDFGPNNKMPFTEFKLLMDKLEERRSATSSSVVFLNACESVHNENDFGYLAATARPGIRGCIGTEARVPDDFALNYGANFVKHMVQTNDSVQQTMDQLRDQFWPLSLLYSLYADPEFQINKLIRNTG